MSAVDPSTLEEAEALVGRWGELAHGGISSTVWIVLTDEVKRRMARDIAALIKDTIHRGQYTAS